MILDESQNIKNTTTQTTQATLVLHAEHKLALSGTPVENNLTELYSLFRFLNPTMFGSLDDFNSRYTGPIQRDNDKDLNGCEKLQDINSKIDFFTEYISSQDLPDNWIQFFKDIKKRCKPMKAPKRKYSLLQIPTDDKELQHIILTDPTIRKFTLKAEGFILLVETNFKSKVVEALKKYGYLI